MGETPSERDKENATEKSEREMWIDTVIARLQSLYRRKDVCIAHLISQDEVLRVLREVSRAFMEESTLLECEAPVKVCLLSREEWLQVIGDLHGQFDDMLAVLDLIGRPPETKLLFLGDYVDRGTHSIEVAVYLFALKVRWRDRVFLLRGNHETPQVNIIYGFQKECIWKYGTGIWWDFQACFNRIPMAGLISKKVGQREGRRSVQVLCMHGGLSPHMQSLDQIRAVARPVEPVEAGLLIDLLWADPTNKGDGWFHSIRGMSYMFGRGVVDAACAMLNIDLIIRAHQVVEDGYEMMAGRKLITVFSAPNYCAQFNNAAAVVCLDADLQQLKLEPLPKAHACPSVAADPDPEKARADKEAIKPHTPKTPAKDANNNAK